MPPNRPDFVAKGARVRARGEKDLHPGWRRAARGAHIRARGEKNLTSGVVARAICYTSLVTTTKISQTSRLPPRGARRRRDHAREDRRARPRRHRRRTGGR